MEKTRILNDNRSDLRQKRSEPRSQRVAALHDEQTETRILYKNLAAIGHCGRLFHCRLNLCSIP